MPSAGSLAFAAAVFLVTLSGSAAVFAQAAACACNQTRLYGSCPVLVADYPGEFPGSAVVVDVSAGGLPSTFLYIADLFNGITTRYDASGGGVRLTDPMFIRVFPSPLGSMTTTGIAYNTSDQMLYWAIEDSLYRTSPDLERSGPAVLVARVDLQDLALKLGLPRTGALGGITYHVRRNRFWGVDIANDIYFEFGLDGKPVVDAGGRVIHFRNPLLSNFGGGAYGNSIAYAVADNIDFFDIPVGRLSDGKVTRVERVYAQEGTEGNRVFTFGDPAGPFYLLGQTIGPSDFVTGIFHWQDTCGGGQNTEIVLDIGTSTGRPRVHLVSADRPAARGLATFRCAAEANNNVRLTWTRHQGFNRLDINRLDVNTQETRKVFELTSSANDPGEFLDQFIADSVYEYSVRVLNTDNSTYPDRVCRITVGRGQVVDSASFLVASRPRDEDPFPITHIGSQGRILVADLKTGGAHTYDEELTFIEAFEGPFNGTFSENSGLTVGVAWSATDDRLYWVQHLEGENFIQRTDLKGVVAGARARIRSPLNLARIPVLGDLSHDRERDQFWAVDRRNGVAFSFKSDGTLSGSSLTSQLPNPRDLTGLAGGGLALVSSTQTSLVLDWVVGRNTDETAGSLARISYTRTILPNGTEQISSPSESVTLDLRSLLETRLLGGAAYVEVPNQDPFEYVVAGDTKRIYKLQMKEGISGKEFIRGDANADLEINISDPSFILTFLFKGGQAPICMDAADVDDDEILNITDAIVLFGYLFLGGNPPPAPFPACNRDFTQGGLTCERATCQ